MIREVVKGFRVSTGEEVEVVRLMPENDEDEAELRRLEEAGLLNTMSSFAEMNADMIARGLTPPNVDNVRD